MIFALRRCETEGDEEMVGVKRKAGVSKKRNGRSCRMGEPIAREAHVGLKQRTDLEGEIFPDTE